MNEVIAKNIEKIADRFGFELSKGNKCYLGCCPVHEGDNPTALNFYHTGHTTVGNWECKTHACEKTFGKNAIGFIRGILSAKQRNWSHGSKDTVSYPEAIKWCEDFLGIKLVRERTNSDDISYMINRLYRTQDSDYELCISNDAYMNSGLEFPASYFVDRGYGKDTLEEFGVGFCNNPTKPMYSRAVVPLHNQEGDRVIGCLGRSVWEQCKVCKCYHNPNTMCPNKERKGIYSKWKNSSGFPGSTELYNIHRARPFIHNTGIAVLTEGSPNVWRLFEAGFPMSLGCLGSNFSSGQKKVLDSSGAHTIIIVPDADAASEKFVKKIIELCKMSYNIVTIEPSYNDDIGQCNVETVKNILSPFIEKYRERQ